MGDVYKSIGAEQTLVVDVSGKDGKAICPNLPNVFFEYFPEDNNYLPLSDMGFDKKCKFRLFIVPSPYHGTIDWSQYSVQVRTDGQSHVSVGASYETMTVRETITLSGESSYKLKYPYHWSTSAYGIRPKVYDAELNILSNFTSDGLQKNDILDKVYKELFPNEYRSKVTNTPCGEEEDESVDNTNSIGIEIYPNIIITKNSELIFLRGMYGKFTIEYRTQAKPVYCTTSNPYPKVVTTPCELRPEERPPVDVHIVATIIMSVPDIPGGGGVVCPSVVVTSYNYSIKEFVLPEWVRDFSAELEDSQGATSRLDDDGNYEITTPTNINTEYAIIYLNFPTCAHIGYRSEKFTMWPRPAFFYDSPDENGDLVRWNAIGTSFLRSERFFLSLEMNSSELQLPMFCENIRIERVYIANQGGVSTLPEYVLLDGKRVLLQFTYEDAEAISAESFYNKETRTFSTPLTVQIVCVYPTREVRMHLDPAFYGAAKITPIRDHVTFKRMDSGQTVDVEITFAGSESTQKDIYLIIRNYCTNEIVAECTVWLDGQLLGSFPSGENIHLGILDSGNHDIRVTAPDYLATESDNLENSILKVE